MMGINCNQRELLRVKARLAELCPEKLKMSGRSPITNEEIQQLFGERSALAHEDFVWARKAFRKAVAESLKEMEKSDD
jgi:hypothetical protein